MNAADVLERAANLLDRDGWFSFAMLRYYGEHPRCAITALDAITPIGSDEYDQARNALASAIGTKAIPLWNDAPERTAAEVISTMRACAALLRARESAPMPQPEEAEQVTA